MRNYVGLDVSMKETFICIVDETGKIIREGLSRTMYRPSLGRHPYSTNLEYFNAQK